MGANKLKVIQDYKKLSKELQEQVKLAYPEGFSEFLIYYTNAKGQKVSALPFETEEKVYLLKMSAEMAVKILDDDSDYEDDQNLKGEVNEIYDSVNSKMEFDPEDDD